MSRDEIIKRNSLVEFVRARGNELRPAGKNFVTSACPVAQHKQYHRCVTIDVEKGLWHCNDCKIGGTVIEWEARTKGISGADAMRELGGGVNNSEPRKEFVCAYPYVDEGGELLSQSVRYKVPPPKKKDFSQRRPDGKGGWIWDLKGVRRVLYRLSEVIAAETVVVVEGEKDADTLAKLGFTATTNIGGAKKWRDEYSETLRGKHVIVIGDNDDDGRKHVAQVIESLTGIARSLRHVVLPIQFKDVSDYIASLPQETAREAIAKLIDEAPTAKVTVTSEPRDEAGEDLTSLSSCAVAYPAPPDEAAFYGLAGDIVQRMAPHTEADPVALLVQFLVLFGNIIGRRAHAVADGAWHYFNLFCVLVGETSKGRKGTALHHMLQLFEHADEEAWRKNCLASGLSSGEGVIYAVRDEIKTTKPVKEKGKYTGKSIDVVTDSGVADKRLMVIETEFCSAIKVMTREGNILSATLRQAWDSGNLRILTKNSPVRASGAHISIIAHITRHEARHELTETESANGFGNRILWTAARRSKCLPEGGESYGVADLVVRLHKAIEFGRATGELQRSDEARKAWARVYPELSEGKPGLLGAITARAEAQVLRLSNLYALLDCLGTVEVDHLRAALALWAYCERSAGWIFESGTGSRNADKILAALKAAGEKGLTKSEITSYVFNRNATKFEIEEALRLLVEFELAHRLAESTGGRRAERWFYKGAGHEEYEESRSEESQRVVTSFSSSPQLSKKVSLAESDTDPSKPESKVVSGEVDATVEQSADLPASAGVPIEADEKGVGRL